MNKYNHHTNELTISDSKGSINDDFENDIDYEIENDQDIEKPTKKRYDIAAKAEKRAKKKSRSFLQ